VRGQPATPGGGTGDRLEIALGEPALEDVPGGGCKSDVSTCIGDVQLLLGELLLAGGICSTPCTANAGVCLVLKLLLGETASDGKLPVRQRWEHLYQRRAVLLRELLRRHVPRVADAAVPAPGSALAAGRPGRPAGTSRGARGLFFSRQAEVRAAARQRNGR